MITDYETHAHVTHLSVLAPPTFPNVGKHMPATQREERISKRYRCGHSDNVKEGGRDG
jgi:hypothetical protein